jgi:hypothetical protein
LSFGPLLRVAWRQGRVVVGLEGEGRFVPRQVAAPRAALNVIWGIEF